jgi:chromosome segregation ATPase
LLQRIESLNKDLVELTEKYNSVSTINSSQANDLHRLEQTIEGLKHQISTYEQEIETIKSSVVPNNSGTFITILFRLTSL